MKTILVTGSAGFIGAHLVLRLLESGEPLRIVGLDNLNGYYDPALKVARLKLIDELRPRIKSGVTNSPVIRSRWSRLSLRSGPGLTRNLFQFIRGDITDAALLDRLFAENRFDIVVNLAAQVGARNSLEQPQAYVDSNVTGFLNILEACRKYEVKHLVFASSSSVYGLNEKAPFAESDPTDRPVSPYAATKKCDELLAHVYSQAYGLRVTGLRFFTVYGPWGRPDMAPMLFAKAICAGEPINVFNNGDLMRDFTYIDDIIEGIVRVIGKTPDQVGGDESSRHAGHEERHSGLDPESHCPDPASYALYNIGGGQPVLLLDFVQTLQEELIRTGVLPADYDFEAHKQLVPMQPGDVPVTYADSTALERDFGFTPKITLREGLRHFAEWYKEYYS